jgi:hypothetical protein
MGNLRAWGPALLLLALFVGVMMLPAKANTPYRFLEDRALAGNDQQRMLNTVADHYGMGRDRLEPVIKRLGRVEQELPVLLFMADESGKPLETVLEMRKSKDGSWLEVMKKAGIKLNVLFAGVEGTFPEPYKASWTEWRMKYRPELSDEQVRELAFLQLAHRISGRPMKELARSPNLPLEALAMGKPKKKDGEETAEAKDAKAKAEAAGKADKAEKPARKRAR